LLLYLESNWFINPSIIRDDIWYHIRSR
jgi:hypothetical protein